MTLQFLQGAGEKKIEIQQKCSKLDHDNIFQGGIPEGPIRTRLAELGLTNSLQVIGTTESIRHRRIFLGGYCEIEQVSYPDGSKKYQVEYRSKDADVGMVRHELGLSVFGEVAPRKGDELFAHIDV